MRRVNRKSTICSQLMSFVIPCKLYFGDLVIMDYKSKNYQTRPISPSYPRGGVPHLAEELTVSPLNGFWAGGRGIREELAQDAEKKIK